MHCAGGAGQPGQRDQKHSAGGNSHLSILPRRLREFPLVHEQLLAYAREHDMTPHGYFRHIYMEGPPTHGENKEAYVTQVALPIKFVELSAGSE